MKTDYEYIRFEKVKDKPKTSVWACINKKSRSILGFVSWYPQWRQYCFMPADQSGEWEDIVLSAGCLSDIAHFVRQAMREHKS